MVKTIDTKEEEYYYVAFVSCAAMRRIVILKE